MSHVGATTPSQREHSLLWSTREATDLWTGVQKEESITVTGIIVLVILKEILSSPAFEEVIDDEEEVPVEEPVAPEAAAEEVPAAPEAIPDAVRHRVLQRCMALENLKTP